MSEKSSDALFKLHHQYRWEGDQSNVSKKVRRDEDFQMNYNVDLCQARGQEEDIIAAPPGPPPSFLCCAICSSTPTSPPLFGCEQGHVICLLCREVGGALLSCPTCGSQDISHRLSVAEELLSKELLSEGVLSVTENNKIIGLQSVATDVGDIQGCLVSNVKMPSSQSGCPHKSAGCQATVEAGDLLVHKEICAFRPYKCPKSLFSTSCSFKGPLQSIVQHGREQHGLNKGVTLVNVGFISSKMFDRSLDSSCCDDNANAKFQPLELVCGKDIFYCYFERVAARRLWFFFVRMYGNEEMTDRYTADIMVGQAGLGRAEWERVGVKYSGSIAHYELKREEVRSRGMVLTVADEVLKAGKEDNVLFRVWFKVEKVIK